MFAVYLTVLFPSFASLVSQAHSRFLIKIDQAFIRAVDLPLLLVLLLH